ncbi:MAG TPA: hypothetical protein VIF88_12450 [Methylocystis sp.]
MTVDMNAWRGGEQLVAGVFRQAAPPDRVRPITKPPARDALQPSDATESCDEQIAVDAARGRSYFLAVGVEISTFSYGKRRPCPGGLFRFSTAVARRFVCVHFFPLGFSWLFLRGRIIPWQGGEAIASQMAP